MIVIGLNNSDLGDLFVSVVDLESGWISDRPSKSTYKRGQ